MGMFFFHGQTFGFQGGYLAVSENGGTHFGVPLFYETPTLFHPYFGVFKSDQFKGQATHKTR